MTELASSNTFQSTAVVTFGPLNETPQFHQRLNGRNDGGTQAAAGDVREHLFLFQYISDNFAIAMCFVLSDFR